MLSTYCQHCGSKNEYRFEKPKFCSKCGESFSGEVSKASKPKARQVPEAKRIESDFDEEGTEIYEVPEISRLEYDIEPIDSHSSFTLGSLFKNSEVKPHSVEPKKKRGRPRKNGKT
jgi:hypothetical protein